MKQEANKRQLTDLLVRKIGPRDKPFLIWDTKQRGLALRVQPTGHKSWKCIYARSGRPRWYSIGAADAIDLSDARKLAGRIMFAVAEGKDPQAERIAARGQGTFAELAARYVKEYSSKKNKSYKQAERLVDKYLVPRWGKLPAADISRSDVKSALAAVAAPVLSNQVLAAGSAVFSWAIREEILKVNPCQKIERNETTSRERILSDRELPLFWAEFNPALRLLLLLGQRPGEISAMHRAHMEGGWWTLPGKPEAATEWPGTKNGETHRVWLSQPAVSLLGDLAMGEATGPVFPQLRSLDATMRDICAKLKINDKVTPHDLRRTFSSKVTALGFGRDAMNRVTNHKEGGIASVYDRYEYADENKKIMEAVATHLMSLVAS
ncbi:integrase family protein [Bradyrhizobium japonicum]|uniref:tyrosine-type recombinase/integrase n=1 Tax=Bradyrhizobium japonicum TaxID=375 RepID=UPI001BA6FCB4|nr:integrase family protein [Bradyrhizobium japonicum]MBR0804117.1 integrase family protein [Bradyrhizobium japonicum]